MTSASDANAVYISPSWSKKAQIAALKGDVFTYRNIACTFWNFYILLSTRGFRDHWMIELDLLVRCFMVVRNSLWIVIIYF